MEKKEFSVKEIAAFKRIAMNVDSSINKKNKLEAKKVEIEKELKNLYEEIDLMEAPVKKKTGGYGIEDLFVKVITATGKKYELKYPETFFPPQPVSFMEDEAIDEFPVDETETTVPEAPFNPLEGLEY